MSHLEFFAAIKLLNARTSERASYKKSGMFNETWLQCIVCPLFLHENNSCRPNLARLRFFLTLSERSERPSNVQSSTEETLTRNSIIMSRLTLLDGFAAASAASTRVIHFPMNS